MGREGMEDTVQFDCPWAGRKKSESGYWQQTNLERFSNISLLWPRKSQFSVALEGRQRRKKEIRMKMNQPKSAQT